MFVMLNKYKESWCVPKLIMHRVIKPWNLLWSHKGKTLKSQLLKKPSIEFYETQDLSSPNGKPKLLFYDYSWHFFSLQPIAKGNSANTFWNQIRIYFQSIKIKQWIVDWQMLQKLSLKWGNKLEEKLCFLGLRIFIGNISFESSN